LLKKNPGITRLLNGDALMGEATHLQDRVVRFHNRLESQLKQILREAEVRGGLTLKVPVTVAANTMLLFTDGKISQFVRSRFERGPTQHWELQWPMIASQIFAS
jgi:TetR/AcrR family transcriptional regulator